jgi:Domain of unknown function (DUF6916)
VSDRLELATFEPCVGDGFRIEGSEGSALNLTLTEATTGPWQPEEGSTFAFELIFRGPADPALPQATYRMAHATLGSVDIFIVPIARDADVTTYQAVFS